jgi:hypothetical protein
MNEEKGFKILMSFGGKTEPLSQKRLYTVAGELY